MAMHWFITFIKLLFSRAAATLSLSASCLFTAISEVCVPGVISTVTLNRGGNDRNSFTLIDKPINVAMLSCTEEKRIQQNENVRKIELSLSLIYLALK